MKTNLFLFGLAGLPIAATLVFFASSGVGQASTYETRIVGEARTPISSLPFLIDESGSYFVTRGLTGVGGMDGISIEADDVTIDLNGFSLTGVAGSMDGIGAPASRSNVKVFNGIIANWGGDGLGLKDAENCTIEGLTSKNNTGVGIHLGDHSQLLDCRAQGNGLDGVVLAGEVSVVRGCISVDNTGNGYLSKPTALFEGCMATTNGVDGFASSLSTTRARMSNCFAHGNAGVGFGGSSVAHLTGCVGTSNSGGGYTMSQGGLMKECLAYGNGDDGVNISGFGNFLSQSNFMSSSGSIGAIDNSANPNNNTIINCNVQTGTFTGVGLNVGPVEQANSSASPFANF